MRHLRLRALGIIGTFVVVALVLQQPGRAQNGPSARPPNPHRLALVATTPAAVAESNSRIAPMLKTGELVKVRVEDDPQIARRQMQTLQQFYKGIPVEGGSVCIQKANALTISVFGTLFDGISMDTTPAIEPIDATRIIEEAANASIAFGASPTLVIVPSPAGAFGLAYTATVENAMTYYVDAMTGTIVNVVDEKQYDVGVGTGTLGDQKKMATTLIGSTYRTKDTLRPAGISTYDTGGSPTAFSRMVNGNNATDSDLAANTTNTWTNGYVVDAHTNTGFTYDYFFRRQNWSGLDGSNRPMSVIVHSGLLDNAEFIPAPFGPNKNGVMVFGRTGEGFPVAALDVAGHELMHGVTSFSLTNRTGTGLLSNVVLTGTPGPSSFTYNGSSFPCATTVLVDGRGNRFPFFCSNGRYLLAANHGGAINEAFSDMFGTSVEFFYQPPGSGPLKADYLMGEDIKDFGPLRSLDDPASLSIRNDFGSTPYPDHVSNMINYALLAIGGTPANPAFVEFSPVGFVNGNFVFFFNSGGDGGGVHDNSTVLSHAFYLAIEGGRDATSGVSVTGVGAANRAEIEKVFFRAMTQLMPNSPDLPTAAAVAIQAAVDLYGAGSPAAQAVTEAMSAVGLR